MRVFIDDILLNEDESFAQKQQARHVMVALKRYYETHLAVMAEQLRRTHLRNQGNSSQMPPTPSKVGYVHLNVKKNINNY